MVLSQDGDLFELETVIIKAANQVPSIPCAGLTYNNLLTPDALFLLLLAQKRNLWHGVCANLKF